MPAILSAELSDGHLEHHRDRQVEFPCAYAVVVLAALWGDTVPTMDAAQHHREHTDIALEHPWQNRAAYACGASLLTLATKRPASNMRAIHEVMVRVTVMVMLMVMMTSMMTATMMTMMAMIYQDT